MYQTTNNFKRFLNKKFVKHISIIMTLILISICIYIILIRFLENNAFKVVLYINRKILMRLVIVY